MGDHVWSTTFVWVSEHDNGVVLPWEQVVEGAVHLGVDGDGLKTLVWFVDVQDIKGQVLVLGLRIEDEGVGFVTIGEAHWLALGGKAGLDESVLLAVLVGSDQEVQDSLSIFLSFKDTSNLGFSEEMEFELAVMRINLSIVVSDGFWQAFEGRSVEFPSFVEFASFCV